ncbi:hypothetical protein Bca4012_094411 [Brassica carinata]|uniref:Uncharacterized protein n=3 Tax=Brassica TaxID=3705 RepID=A0A0D3DQN4_BRAOL|nr:unnamed protein product [Brassica napus]CDY33655.1 BnaC08g19550D [Brassica napus]VDD56445.1 unnamed protein product [Brassica oleracea]
MNPMFYFLLALTTVLAVTAGPVLDTDGDIIFHGSYYAIPLPADIKRGGLDLLPDLDHQCPLYVTMSGRLFKKLTRAYKLKSMHQLIFSSLRPPSPYDSL